MPPPPPTKQQDIDEFAWGGEVDDYEYPTLPESPVMNGELGRYVMEQTVAKILFHSGFEGNTLSS